MQSVISTVTPWPVAADEDTANLTALGWTCRKVTRVECWSCNTHGHLAADVGPLECPSCRQEADRTRGAMVTTHTGHEHFLASFRLTGFLRGQVRHRTNKAA